MDKEPNNKNRLSLQSVRESLRTLSLSTLLLIVTTAVALVAVGSLAWMSENRKLDADGVHANMDDELFELGVTQTSSSSLSGYANKLQTNDQNISILCDLDVYSVDGDTQVRPGSHGTLTFNIIPKKDNLTFAVRVDFRAITSSHSIINASSTLDQKCAANYLNGHLIVFTNEGRTTMLKNGDIYGSGESNYFYITTATVADTPTPVTLYWEWAQTYERLKTILNENNILLSYQTPSENSAQLTSAQEALYIFHFNNLNDNNYNDGYNDADQVIGDYVRYILADVTVQTAPSQSAPAQSSGGEGGEVGE